MTDVRMIVYDALLDIEKGIAQGDVGKDLLDKYAYLDKQQRAFMHYLFDGVIDRTITLDYVIDTVSSVPVRKMKKPVRVLMRMGAYQILFMDSVPDRAACNETVSIARKKHLDKLSGFINGVLRSICRLEGKIEYPSREDDIIRYLSVYYSMPEIIVKSLVSDYGIEVCEELLSESTANRPLIARCMNSRCEKAALIESLNAYENVSVSEIEGTDALVFDSINSLDEISQFSDGLFTIQDLSSQIACMVAGVKPGDTVIDVCAAPGGKSIATADILNGTGKVISCDVSEQKLERIRENIDRMHLSNMEAHLYDATKSCPELLNRADVLIADVPCSGFGVMGRKRDIKYAINDESLQSLPDLQRAILRNVVSYIKPGGILLYSTCTVRKAENDENYDFIKNELGLTPVSFYDELPKQFKCESAKEGLLQLFNGKNNTDGFFIAKFYRKS